MDPYTEQRLRNEVIYLHSLWHQGPPKPPLQPPPPFLNLHPSNSHLFKKPYKNKPNPRRKTLAKFSGKEWPVKPPPSDPPLTPSGWPELKLKPKPQPVHSLTPDQLEKHKWNQVQQRALTVTKKFYSDDENDEDDDDMVDDENESEDDEDVDDVGDKVYGFVMKLFNEDEELKGYYMKHCVGGGEFVCLICGGANEKFGKRFKDCVALVQHSVSVTKKTKKRRSHRAFGKAVCEVLGWEVDRLPSSSIVLDEKGNDGEVNRDVNDLKSVADGENSNGKTSDVAERVDDESMVCEDVTAVANVEEEHDKNQVLNEAEGCRGGGVVNNLCRNLSSTMVLEPVPSDLQTN